MTAPQTTIPRPTSAHPEPVEGPRATPRLNRQPSTIRTPGWQPLEDLIPADLLKAEARHWATRIGVTLREVHVRPMARKWASCSSRGRLTFSHDLLRQPAPFRTEVIVHELVHLKVPNHGRLFRALVRAYLGRPVANGLRAKEAALP